MTILRIFFIAVLFFSCRNTTPEIETHTATGKVVKIADGDTFTLLKEGNQQEKVRLHGIDCPERNQPFGNVAKQTLSDLVFGKQVTVERLSTDRYGRTIAHVFVGDVHVNHEMVKRGLAWHYKKYDQSAAIAQLEKSARAAKIGIWSHPQPVAPWEWRRKK